MSPTMLLEEAEVSLLMKSVKPIEVELNKNDSVNSILTIKKWGFKAILEALSKATLVDKSKLGAAVKLAYVLSEFDFHLVERAVDRAGCEICEDVLKRVTDLLEKASKDLEVLVLNRDALFTIDGIRRTPGGIFWRFLKEKIPKEDSKYIFKDNTKRQQSLRRQLVRDKWTENHLTVLKSQKRHKTEVASPDNEEKLKVVKDIAASLSMSEVSIIERLVVKKGVEFARKILSDVNDVLVKADSAQDKSLVMVTEPDAEPRRRTPGGVFAQLIKCKADISDSDKRFIFARATGGRAPSMSDLMSMSLALKDRVVKRTSGSAAKAAEQEEEAAGEEGVVTWEFQRKVGNTWEPGFIGQENYGNPIPELPLSEDSMDTSELVARIASGLKLTSWDMLEKVIAASDVKSLIAAYKETIALEKKGGIPLSECNQRRRTPLGVFLFVLRRNFGDAFVENVVGQPPKVLAPQVLVSFATSKSKLADAIIVELEKLRIPDSDFEIVGNIVAIKGEIFVRSLFEKVRKRFNKRKWLDTPGQLFGKMLKIGLSNEELNAVFESSRNKQLVRNNKRSAAPILAPDSNLRSRLLEQSEEKCAQEVTIGLALIGVTANEVSTIERVIERLGEERAVRMLNRTKEIELEGGQRTRDEQRRKTPSGVFLSLLSTEEKVSKDELKFIFDKQGNAAYSSPEDRKKEDSHFAPSLFTPVNPFRVIDNSGRDPEFIQRIKKQIRPTLSQLDYISVLDPRLETVIRGVVLLGPSAINLIDQCVHTFGEKRTEGWLEISHAQVADSKAPVEQLPDIYNDLVKAAGGLPSLETTAGIRS